MISAANKQPPTMLWDGDCDFCRKQVRRWQRLTGTAVVYRPYQEALSDFPHISRAACRAAVQLALPDGRVFSAARAVLYSLFLAGRFRLLWWAYCRVPLFAALCEAWYLRVARRRAWFYKVFRFFSVRKRYKQ